MPLTKQQTPMTKVRKAEEKRMAVATMFSRSRDGC